MLLNPYHALLLVSTFTLSSMFSHAAPKSKRPRLSSETKITQQKVEDLTYKLSQHLTSTIAAIYFDFDFLLSNTAFHELALEKPDLRDAYYDLIDHLKFLDNKENHKQLITFPIQTIDDLGQKSPICLTVFAHRILANAGIEKFDPLRLLKDFVQEFPEHFQDYLEPSIDAEIAVEDLRLEMKLGLCDPNNSFGSGVWRHLFYSWLTAWIEKATSAQITLLLPWDSEESAGSPSSEESDFWGNKVDAKFGY